MTQSPGETTRSLNPQPMVPLNVEISAELKDRLLAYAGREGLSQASAVRLGLHDFLTREGFPRA